MKRDEIITVCKELHHFDRYCHVLRDKYVDNNKLLFIQIPQVILDSFNRETALGGAYYIFPPTGIQYLYESIKHRNIEVRILDLNYEILKRLHTEPEFNHNDWTTIIDEYLDDFQPSIVGLSCLFDVGIAPLLKVLKALQSRGKSIVIAGGVIATYEWKTLLSHDFCHFAVQGEGENKINYLLDKITYEDFGSEETPGILYNIDKQYHETSGKQDIVEVKGDLISSYQLVNIADYYKYGSLNPFSRREHGSRAPFAAIQLSRGCRGECSFCAVRSFMGRGVRSRPIHDILAEVSYLINSCNVRHFELLDDDPTFNMKLFKTFLREIISRNWKIQWSANNGMIAASIDEELLGLIRDSGCIGFKIGIETGNPAQLRKIRKPGTHQKFLNFSKMLDKYPQIFVGGNFIIGLPEENFSQMIDSFTFALKVNLDWAAMTVCQIVRGASAFADAGEYFESQMKSEGKYVKNFIPSRHSTTGQITYAEKIYKALDIFKLEPGVIPGAEQVKEIWFTFNLLVNYVFNKNLLPGGYTDKFIAWVDRVLSSYPVNPYMNLFLGLAYRIEGNAEKASYHLQRAKTNIYGDAYWEEKFKMFGLDKIINHFPDSTSEVFSCLQTLQQSTLKKIGLDKNTIN